MGNRRRYTSSLIASTREGPSQEASSARGPDAVRTRNRVTLTRKGLLVATVLPAVFLVVNKRATLGMAVGVLGRLDWVWVPLGLTFEAISFSMVARGQRRLLGACAAPLGLGPIVRTVFVSNALSTSIPFAGPQLGTVYSFRRFKRLGAEPVAAGWVLTAGGAISSVAAALLLLAGALLSGSRAAVIGAATGGTLSAVALGLALAPRASSCRAQINRTALLVLRTTRKLLGRPKSDPSQLVRRFTSPMENIALSANDWILVSAAALFNWVADIAVLAVSITALGGSVPWRGLLLAYAVGAAAGTIGFTPGGIGIVETAMAGSLMAVGVHHPTALASVLLYRLISFWLVTLVGWLIYAREVRVPFASSRADVTRVHIGPREESRKKRTREENREVVVSNAKILLPRSVGTSSGGAGVSAAGHSYTH